MAAMDEVSIYQHDQYELRCGARALEGGKEFVPTLVVSKQVWPTRPREIAVEPGRFPRVEDAVRAAYDQGVRWVLNYG